MPDFRYVEMMKALLQDPELLREIVESNELMRMGPQRRMPSGPTEQDLSRLEAALMESIGRYGSFEKGMPPSMAAKKTGPARKNWPVTPSGRKR